MFKSTRQQSNGAGVPGFFCSVVMARDLDQDEALRLRQQGVILPLGQMLQQALDRYPGAKLLEAELEEKARRLHL